MECPGRVKCSAIGLCVFLGLMSDQCLFILYHFIVPMFLSRLTSLSILIDLFNLTLSLPAVPPSPTCI